MNNTYYVIDRIGAFLKLHADKQSLSWDDAIAYCDAVLEELKVCMALDPLHGVVYQQVMAIIMFKRCQALEMRDMQQ